MIMNGLRKVFWWVMEIIASILYGIRGVWRISRKPYRLIEKKYLPVKILTTIIKLVLLVYIIAFGVSIILGIVIGAALIMSFFSSAESGMRRNF